MTKIKFPPFFQISRGEKFGANTPNFFIEGAKCYTWLKSSWNFLSRRLKSKSWNSRRTTRQLNEECEQKYDKNKIPPFFQISRGEMFGANTPNFFIEGAKCYTWLKSSWNFLSRGLIAGNKDSRRTARQFYETCQQTKIFFNSASFLKEKRENSR